MRSCSTGGPLRGALHREAHDVGGRRQGWTHVEHHLDVCSERLLDLDRAFGGEPVDAPVIHRAKRHSVVVDLRRERKDLEATRVGQDVAVEAHEPVQATEGRDRVGTGSQHQVVGVREHDLHAEIAEVVGGEVLHGGARADWHEARSTDLSSRCPRGGRTRTAVARGDCQRDRRVAHQRGACRSSSIASPNDRKR